MKKNVTRVLALAMALLMCLSLLPVSALAGDADFAAMIASAQAAQAAAMGGAAPGMGIDSFGMEPMVDYTDPNICWSSEDGQHLWIEVYDPKYICAWGDCTEENPHILYKSCAYCKESAEWLYLAALDEVQAEVSMMSAEEAQALADDPALLADLENRYKQYIFELPDHFYEKQDGQAPTCTAGGHTAYEQCAICEEIRGYEELDPLGHNWGDYTVTVEPTCTAAGTKVRECLRCGEKEYVDIPALGHDWGEFVTVKEPTCTETGTTKRVCERCGAEDFGEIPANGHSYGDFTILKEATCTEDGSKEHTCAVCEYKETVVIPAAHTWGDFTVTKEATCTEAGEQEHTCTVCDVTETVAIPAKDHSYGEDGVCTVCGAEKPAEPTVEEPTVEEPVVEESKEEESEKEPAGAQPVGAIVEDCRDMYSSFGAFLAEKNAADAKYVVASYTPVDANGHALGEIPAGGVRFDLPLPEGADAASVQVYTYDYSTYSWSPANFFLSDGQATVSSGAYPYPPFAVVAAPAAAGNSGETTPTKQEAVSAEVADEFKNLLNEKGLSNDSGDVVLQDVTPLREDGTEMTNEEVAAQGGVTFEMDLPENYEEGDRLDLFHQNDETGEWEPVTDYEIKGNKIIIHADHFSKFGASTTKGGNTALRGSGSDYTITLTIPDTSPYRDDNIALVGDIITATCEPDAAGLELYWIRQSKSGGESVIYDEDANLVTGNTYKLTSSDLDGSVVCAVREPGTTVEKGRSSAVRVRAEVSIEFRAKAAGEVKVAYKRLGMSEAKEISLTAPYIFLTTDEVTISLEPDSDNEFWFRRIAHWDKNAKNWINDRDIANPTAYPFTVSTNSPNIWLIQDDQILPYNELTPTTSKDEAIQQSGDAVTALTALKESLAEEYSVETTDILEGELRYVTPLWKDVQQVSGKLALEPKEIKAAGGLDFELAYPTGASKNSHVMVYHYVVTSGTKGEWKSVPKSQITLTDSNIEIKDFSDFSPFIVLALPSVQMTFNKNGGSGSDMEPETTVLGGSVTVPDCTFTAPNNKTFAGWSKDANGPVDTNYAPGKSVKMDASVELFAQWMDGYTVTFDPDNSAAVGTIADKHVPEGESITLPTSGYTVTNFVIDKWKDQNGVEKDPGDTVKPEENLDYKAIWKRTHITISYDPNTGTGEMDDQPAKLDTNIQLRKNTFSPPSETMTFAGWSKNSPNNVIDYDDSETIEVPDSDMTLYAVWRDIVTITFSPESNSGKGSGTMAPQKVPSDAERTLNKNLYTPPSSGVAFAGWNERQDGAGKAYIDQAKDRWSGDVTLFAQWGPAITITFDKNSSDASGTMAAQKVAANKSFKLNELGFTNPSATFKGWAKTSTGTPEYDNAATVDPGFSENTTLYAIWDKHAFTGIVKVNGDESGSSGKAYVDETLTATVDPSSETEFSDFRYKWVRDDGKELTPEGKKTETYTPAGSSEEIPFNQYKPTEDDAGHVITCIVYAADSPDKNTKKSNGKTVGVEDAEKKIINDIPADVEGIKKGMYYSLNNGEKKEINSDSFAVTEQGVYRFFADDQSTIPLGTVTVTKWYTVGYVNSTSSSTTSTSTGTSNAGSGTITAKAIYDGTERTLTTSTTIKDDSGNIVLEPYPSYYGYDHVWLVKKDSGVGFSLLVHPSSGSYGHVNINNTGWIPGKTTDQNFKYDPVNYYEMHNIMFNRSSTSPRTADDSHLGLWSALCFMSLAGATVLLNGQRKRRKARR